MVRHMARFRRRCANEGQERGGNDQSAEAGFATDIDQDSPGPVANQDKDVQFSLPGAFFAGCGEVNCILARDRSLSPRPVDRRRATPSEAASILVRANRSDCDCPTANTMRKTPARRHSRPFARPFAVPRPTWNRNGPSIALFASRFPGAGGILSGELSLQERTLISREQPQWTRGH
jgi:hypothetical protein